MDECVLFGYSLQYLSIELSVGLEDKLSCSSGLYNLLASDVPLQVKC